jgi:uncharacterized protein (UPF0261 family)
MEVLTEVPQTGTKLFFDADREFDGQAGDTVMRVKGQTREGTPLFDAAYVEVDEESATVVAALLRAIRQPSAEVTDQIAQIAQQAWKGLATIWPEAERQERTAKLAERFERAAASRRNAKALVGSGSQN